MKKISLSLAVLTLFAAFVMSSCKQDAPVVEEEVVVEEVEEGVSGSFTIDGENSAFGWLGKKVTGEHFGSFSLTEGNFTLANGELTSGKAVADLSTIVVEDIEDEEMNAKLVGHLASEDFFNTTEYPSAVLNITGSEDGVAKGELTIKEITHPVEFPYTVEETEAGVSVSGTMTIDRTLYDIKYGSGKFFENLGDKTIYDEFELSFTAVGTK